MQLELAPETIATTLERLNRIRLERDLSFRALAAEIGMPYRNLVRLLSTPDARMRDRTLYKIQRYLNAADESLSSGRGAKRSAR